MNFIKRIKQLKSINSTYPLRKLQSRCFTFTLRALALPISVEGTDYVELKEKAFYNRKHNFEFYLLTFCTSRVVNLITYRVGNLVCSRVGNSVGACVDGFQISKCRYEIRTN